MPPFGGDEIETVRYGVDEPYAVVGPYWYQYSVVSAFVFRTTPLNWAPVSATPPTGSVTPKPHALTESAPSATKSTARATARADGMRGIVPARGHGANPGATWRVCRAAVETGGDGEGPGPGGDGRRRLLGASGRIFATVDPAVVL